jgi:hypothetical protein
MEVLFLEQSRRNDECYESLPNKERVFNETKKSV